MNYDKLCKMLNYLRDNFQRVHSLVIIQNGHSVVDVNFYPYHAGVPIYLNCCTASIVSALVGIAIGEGLVRSEKDRISGYLPEYGSLLQVPPKGDITIEHLLLMTTGLQWDDVHNVFGEDNYDSRMHGSVDPIRFILEQPMREEPGKSYNHCLGAIHLLSSILQKATGMTAAAFAEEKLFIPLGITGAEWYSDKNGTSAGGNGLSMPSGGLAKIGRLYLQKGRWEGVQIVPESWVSLSTRKHIDTARGPWSFYGTGYQWNISRFGGYATKGVNGQYMAVVPNLNLVVVMMGALTIDELFWPETLMETFILPAAKSAGKNQVSLQDQRKLDKLINELNQQPAPEPVQPMPPLALEISDRNYHFKPPAGIRTVSLNFCGKDYCIVRLSDNQHTTEVPVGLDNVYRVSGKEAYKGVWQNENTFIIKVVNLCFAYEMEYEFTFYKDKLKHKVISPGWGVCEENIGESEAYSVGEG